MPPSIEQCQRYRDVLMYSIDPLARDPQPDITPSERHEIYERSLRFLSDFTGTMNNAPLVRLQRESLEEIVMHCGEPIRLRDSRYLNMARQYDSNDMDHIPYDGSEFRSETSTSLIALVESILTSQSPQIFALGEHHDIPGVYGLSNGDIVSQVLPILAEYGFNILVTENLLTGTVNPSLDEPETAFFISGHQDGGTNMRQVHQTCLELGIAMHGAGGTLEETTLPLLEAARMISEDLLATIEPLAEQGARIILWGGYLHFDIEYNPLIMEISDFSIGEDLRALDAGYTGALLFRPTEAIRRDLAPIDTGAIFELVFADAVWFLDNQRLFPGYGHITQLQSPDGMNFLIFPFEH